MTRILVVKDDAIIVEDLEQRLKKLGYSVPCTAHSGEEALRLALEAQPDLVLMDIKLEGRLDGIETTARLRQRMDVPVIYLTSRSDEMTLARAKETGPHGYLLEPFNERDLRVAIEVALRKHAIDARLAERERWFSTTLESVGDAVVAADSAGCVTFMNAVAEGLTGWKKDAALGKSIDEVCCWTDENGAPLANPLVRAVNDRSASGLPANARLTSKTGVSIEVEDSATPIVDDRGDLLGGVMVFRDISARRKLEQQLAHAERMASIGTLAAGTAHEINNPLAALVGNVSIALERLRSMREELAEDQPSHLRLTEIDEVVEALVDADRAGARVRTIVQDLRKFARTDNPQTEVLALPSAIEAALSLTEHQIRLKARLVRQYGVTPLVQANEGRLVQVFTNLIVNAAQAIHEGEAANNVIRVVTYTDDRGRAVFEVHDSGGGIRKEHLPRVFDPFFTTKSVGSGTGLGLSICHGIVTALGGEISVTSQAGTGTMFRVALPPASGALPTKNPETPEPVSARRGRVLVVDDEAVICRIFERALNEAHDVVTETDARAALARIARGERFDVILCDLTMPVMSGIDFYHAIHLAAPDMAKRFVFVTGGACTDRAEEFLERTQSRVVQKPFTPSSLRAIVADRIN